MCWPRHLLFAKALYSISTLVLISTLSVGKDAERERERGIPGLRIQAVCASSTYILH